MPLSIPSRTRPAVLLLALGIAACGDDGGSADAACPDADPCQCDATRPECSGESTSTSASPVTGSDPSAATTTAASASDDDPSSSGPGGIDAAFSILPRFDVIGTEWVYETEYLDTDDVAEHVCRIEEVFSWPDDQPGATRRCVIDGFELGAERYALYPDRIQRRESGSEAFEPPADLYRVPLQVGDAWEVGWTFTSSGEITESWTVLAEERIELAFGSFDAAKLEVRTTSSAGTNIATTWWVDGIGAVRSESDAYRSELRAFTQP